jgi:hypothetical protein
MDRESPCGKREGVEWWTSVCWDSSRPGCGPVLSHDLGRWISKVRPTSGIRAKERPFGFFSPPPRVRLVHAFERPFENVVATARTCYSAKGIVTEDQASAKPERRDALAKSIYAAGHHAALRHVFPVSRLEMAYESTYAPSP